MKKIILVMCLAIPQLLLASLPAAQNIATLSTQKPSTSAQKRHLKLDTEWLRKQLNNATSTLTSDPKSIDFPLPDGTHMKVQAKKIKVWEKEQTHSQFWALSSTDPTVNIDGVISHTALGIHGMLVKPDQNIVFLSPVSLQLPNDYVVEDKGSINLPKRFEETRLEKVINQKPSTERGGIANRVDNKGISSYRMALAATGEYTEFFGSNTLAQASLGKIISNVNIIYRRDLGVEFTLVDNTDIIFKHPGEGFTADATLTELLEQNGKILEQHIGSSNFDIGHVITVGDRVGGLAIIGAACQPEAAIKAAGVSRAYNPLSGIFDIEYLSHEMGHQLGATHTFNSNQGLCAGTRNPETAFEPGSGSSIMSYAGLCGIDNTRDSSIPVFHIASIEQIKDNLQQYEDCGTLVDSDSNTPPIIHSYDSHIIVDAGKPFTLNALASDVDDDELTYSWDQVDTGAASHLTEDLGDNAIFETMLPTTSPQRTFAANAVFNRDIHFKLVVRDGKGAIAMEDVVVTVVNGQDIISSHPAGESGGGSFWASFFFLGFFLNAFKLRQQEIEEKKLMA